MTSVACVAWRFCRAGRTSGEAAIKIITPAPISSRFLCPRPPLLLSAPNQNRHATQAMTSAAITTLPKTTHNTSTVNTGETSSNYSVILSLSPHKSSHGTFLDSLTVDLFKIPDVDQRLKRRHTTPAFKTIF